AMTKRTTLLFCVCFALVTGCAKKSQPNSSSGNTTGGTTGNTTPSSPGDVVGKVIVGYQAWFAVPGDGSPWNGWWHWPGSVDPNYKAWPDMRQYTGAYPSLYANLNNGQPSNLFSDW